MSQFPPCSGRPGMVLAPSLPTFSLISEGAFPACTFVGLGGWATMRSMWEQAWISSLSRLFHVVRISADGAQPRMPGWMRPAKRTPGICREEQNIPSKSHIAFALRLSVSFCYTLHGIERQTYAFGYSSSKKPPPFSFVKIPVKPHG